MTKLNAEARRVLAVEGISVAAWQRHWGRDDATTWRGDACGCRDDRCIGFHHEADEDCGCLPVLVEMYVKDQS